MPTDTNTALLQNILQDLNTHIDGLEQMAIIRRDGTLLARFYSTEKGQSAKQIFAEFAALTDEVRQILDRGSNTEAIIKGQHRFLAIYRTHGTNTILGIVGQASVNLGLLNSGSRMAIEKIETIITE